MGIIIIQVPKYPLTIIFMILINANYYTVLIVLPLFGQIDIANNVALGNERNELMINCS